MPSIEVLITFTIAVLIMNISPGPSNLYVMARTIAQGPKAGVVAALGLATGTIVHVIAATLGLSAIFEHSPVFYTLVKLAGAFYLIFLGIRFWLDKQTDEDTPCARKAKSLSEIYKESIFVEISNPKTALFFIALLPQFVVPEAGPVTFQLFVLGIIVTISALPCDLLVAFSSNKLANWLNRHKHAQIIQERISGTILFGLGAYIATEEIRSRT